MKVLVTGAGGFIGSHLCEALTDEGYDVRALVRYNSQHSWGWLEHSPVKNKIEVINGDVRDLDSVRKALKGVETVYHLAALISIPHSYKTQQAFMDVNIKGSLNLFQASLLENVKKVIQTSSSEVYGTAQYVPIDERHPINPQSPYAATKAGADYLALSFYKSFDLPIAIARPFNTYGPRQSTRAVIPTIITQLLAGKKKIKLGMLSPVRDFVYVKDTVRGFIEIANSNKAEGEEINIATQSGISIKELAEQLISKINPGSKVVTEKIRFRPGKSEVQKLLGSNAKIKKITKWKPRYSIEEGMEETVEWFKKNLHLYKTGIYNM